jgi:hypothetical protein
MPASPSLLLGGGQICNDAVTKGVAFVAQLGATL